MNITFNSNIANALINGHPIPAPLVHQFVQEAYDTFQYAQNTHSRIKELENELSVVKAALLDSEEELGRVKENTRIAQEYIAEERG